MGYEPNFPVNQLGGQNFLWVIVEYGLSGIWVRRELTVPQMCVAMCMLAPSRTFKSTPGAYGNI